MKISAENEGIRMVADFICEAIQPPEIVQMLPKKRGRSKGVPDSGKRSLDIVQAPHKKESRKRQDEKAKRKSGRRKGKKGD